MDTIESKPNRPATWRRWLGRWGLIVAILGITVWLSHPQFLRWIGGGLIYREAREPDHVDVLIVLGGKPGYAKASEWLEQDKAGSLMLYHRVPSRAVALGVLPSHYELSRKVVSELNIPQERIGELAGESASEEDLLARVLELERQGKRVGLVLIEWQSGLIHELLLRQEADVSQHPALLLIDDPEVHADNWWYTRHGVRQISMFWARLLAARISDDSYHRTPVTNEDFRRYAIAQ